MPFQYHLADQLDGITKSVDKTSQVKGQYLHNMT